MKKLFTTIYRKILRILPTKLALYIIFFRGYKKILNLKDPKYYGEKIQWLKLYGGLEELSDYVDKYKVREYVKNTIGEQYLNEIYGIYNSENDIDFNSLPEKFVLKSTNGSGSVLICYDKNTFDISKAKKTMAKWLKDDYSKEKKEPQYKNIKNRIIVEKYLNNNNDSLTDYKFYCFNGVPLYYGVFYDRYTDKKVGFYDYNGNKLNIQNSNIKNSEITEPFDNRIEEMLKLSSKLSKKFTFVRVDFYYVDDMPIFGELTFTDGAGSDSWSPLEFDLKIADKIPLKKVLKKNVINKGDI